jgi:hypothetical protein
MSVYHNVQEYLTALRKYNNAGFRIVNGVGYVFAGGRWVESKNTTRPTYQPDVKENPDGTSVGGSTFVKRKT